MKFLEETIQQDDILVLTDNHIVSDAKTLSHLFEEAISKGLEGLVAKKLESLYEADARDFNWVKLKRHLAGARYDTIDCVLLRNLFGRGKRAELGAGRARFWLACTIKSRTCSLPSQKSALG